MPVGFVANAADCGNALCSDGDACTTVDACTSAVCVRGCANLDATCFSTDRVDGRDVVLLADAWNSRTIASRSTSPFFAPSAHVLVTFSIGEQGRVIVSIQHVGGVPELVGGGAPAQRLDPLVPARGGSDVWFDAAGVRPHLRGVYRRVVV